MKKIYTSILIRTDMVRVMDVLAKKGKKDLIRHAQLENMQQQTVIIHGGTIFGSYKVIFPILKIRRSIWRNEEEISFFTIVIQIAR